jgi:hypothetical protein
VATHFARAREAGFKGTPFCRPRWRAWVNAGGEAQDIVYSGNLEIAGGPLFRSGPTLAIARAHKISVKPRKPWEKTVNYPKVT